MDGYETLAAIKSDEALRHLPVIMISRRRRAGQRRALHRDGRRRLPAQAVQPGRPPGRALSSRRLPTSACTTSRWPTPRQAELLETIERQKDPSWPLPVAPGGGARLEPGGRAACSPAIAARRRPCSATCAASPPSAETAEPEEVLGVLREYHAAMGDADRRARRHARALRRRRDDGLLQRSGAPGRPRGARGAHGRRDARRVRRARTKLGASVATSSAWGSASRPGYATLGRIGFEGRYDYGMVGTAVIVASRLSSRGRGRPDPAQPARPRRGRGAGRRGAGRRAAAQGLQPPGHRLQHRGPGRRRLSVRLQRAVRSAQTRDDESVPPSRRPGERSLPCGQ